jgi:hypothetical protein
MKRKILAGTAALATALGMTTSAIAFDQGNATSSRFTGVRGFTEWRHGGWSSQRVVGGRGSSAKRAYSGAGYTDLGPLGVKFGDYAPGAGYGSPIAAWSR